MRLLCRHAIIAAMLPLLLQLRDAAQHFFRR